MVNHRAIAFLPVAIVCVAILGAQTRANAAYLKGFSHGDVQDDSPASWWNPNKGHVDAAFQLDAVAEHARSDRWLCAVLTRPELGRSVAQGCTDLGWKDAVLCVNDILAAEEAPSDLGNCSGAPNISCRNSMAPGTFCEGLTDDVRMHICGVRP